jgi:predicted permease
MEARYNTGWFFYLASQSEVGLAFFMPDRHQPLPLGPPQFGLRTLLLAVSMAAILLGLSQWVSPLTLAAVVFLLVSILAHVAGNVIGSRLRDGGSTTAATQDKHEHTTLLKDHHFAKVTKLGHRQSLGWLPLAISLLGLILGAAIGGFWTAWLLRSDWDWFPIIVAACAFGALGGFGGFLVSGFCKSFGDAWNEAANEK